MGEILGENENKHVSASANFINQIALVTVLVPLKSEVRIWQVLACLILITHQVILFLIS